MTLKVRLPYPDEDISKYPAFDFTKLSAINTCPTWGIIRYGHHKTFASNYRAMALEAGEACHQVFAAVRLADLILYGQPFFPNHDVRSLSLNRACELFGRSRGTTLLRDVESKDDDERTTIIRAALSILETSGFYDDPSDKRRTIDKLSEAVIAYIDRYEFGQSMPVIRTLHNGNVFVGVENAFEIVGEYEVPEYTCLIRLTGKIDGVHMFKNDPDDLYIEENKTASRLGDAWEQSFEMSHQVTGYIMAARTLFEAPDIERAKIRGLAIPQPRIHDGAGVIAITVFRRPHAFQEWADWIIHTCELYAQYYQSPLNAPKYTHSCNRYFRPCSFIPLCTASPDERGDFYEDMVTEEWSPLTEKAHD